MMGRYGALKVLTQPAGIMAFVGRQGRRGLGFGIAVRSAREP